MIEILERGRTFHLHTQNTSLILTVLDSGHLVQAYWGKRVWGDAFSFIVHEIARASYLSDTGGIKDFKLEQQPLVYPAFGNPDLRNPAFVLEDENGSRISDFRFLKANLMQGAQVVYGMPCLKSQEAETLEIVLQDKVQNLDLVLRWSVFDLEDAISQSVKLINQGEQAVRIHKMMSACSSFLEDDFVCLSLNGAWGRECHLHKEAIRQGTFLIDSKRGASGHGQNPWIALADPDLQEDHGRIWSMNLIYSGSFEASVEVDMHQNARMMIGINPFDFEWYLKPQQSFETPEAVLVFSDGGLQKMSRIYHKLYRNCLIPAKFVHKERPVVLNSWEAAYFDFNKGLLLDLAKEAAKVGAECFVLDDGWFGKRMDETSSLGDWQENQEKLGGTLAQLSNEIHALGLQFGLWVEPEMVSPNSTLFKEHPDWIIRTASYDPQLSRHQYVLDLSRMDVQGHLIHVLRKVLSSAKIDYVKWDMNRNITDSGSASLRYDQQKELGHRYMLGLYRVLETITSEFPDVLFEGCAGGGGRFDPGMLAYFPQIWVSDDTDPIERGQIQFGTSLLYPPSALSCHISESPNHQSGRISSQKTRAICAMMGTFGLEQNLTKMDEASKAELAKLVEQAKKMRPLVLEGELIRLKDTDNEKAWMLLDLDQVVVSYMQTLAKVNRVPKRLRLRALDPASRYFCQESGRTYTGSTLMEIGLPLPKVKEDFYACQWHLTREKTESNDQGKGAIEAWNSPDSSPKEDAR